MHVEKVEEGKNSREWTRERKKGKGIQNGKGKREHIGGRKKNQENKGITSRKVKKRGENKL